MEKKGKVYDVCSNVRASIGGRKIEKVAEREREREKGRERNINYCMSQSSKWRVFSGDVRFSRLFYYSLLARPRLPVLEVVRSRIPAVESGAFLSGGRSMFNPLPLAIRSTDVGSRIRPILI